MDTKDIFSQNNENGREKIILAWNVSAFISIPTEGENIHHIQSVQGTLYSHAFRTDADIKNNWSVPRTQRFQILLSILRWNIGYIVW